MCSAAENRQFNPDLASDLRRRRTRDLTERIVERAKWLPPEDRALVEAVYANGMAVRRIAPVAQQSCRKVSRRVRRAVSRVLSPRFVFVAHHMGSWHPTRRRVAEACVLRGRTMREAADELRVSLHTVRRHLAAVEALYEAAQS